MSRLLQIISIALFTLFVVTGGLWRVDRNKLEVYRKIHYLDSLTIGRKDGLIQQQDSIIHSLAKIKITKITIIEKDTVSYE